MKNAPLTLTSFCTLSLLACTTPTASEKDATGESADTAARQHLIEGTQHDDTLEGTTKSDLIKGYGGDDLLNGYESDDRLVGGCGSDEYEFGRVIGHDTVEDSGRCAGTSSSDRNIATFTHWYSYEASFSRDGDALVVKIDRDNDIRFMQFFTDAVITALRFHDGKTLSRAEVIATVTPAKGDLSDLHLASHSSSGAEDACATEYAFSPDRVEYTCKQLFQDARLTVIATAPDADRVEATYKTRSCVSCPFESKTIRVRSGEAFDIDGYYVPFGEERTNYVEATLRTIRRGQTTEHPISLVSRQWR